MSELNQTLIEIETNYKEIQRILINIKKKGVKNFTVRYLQDRLTYLCELYQSTKEKHARATALASNEDKTRLDYFTSNFFDLVMDNFEQSHEYILDNINELSVQPELSIAEQTLNNTTLLESSHLNQIKLPKIELPKFSGNYASWPNFSDRFGTLIHNNPSLSNIQKFQYLSSCLTGEAFNVVKALSITSDNYSIAWSAVTDRYENKRIIIATLLNKFMEINPIMHNNLKTLKYMNDTYSLTIESLKNLHVDVSNWDPILIHLLVKKFDKELLNDWEKEISGSSDFPSRSQFDKFILAKIRALESIDITQTKTSKLFKPNSNFKTKNFNTVVNKFKCPLCENDHKLNRCDQYYKLQTKQRFDFVSDKNLCKNCLSSGHKTKECKSNFKCQKCGGHHNTSLHLESLLSKVVDKGSKGKEKPRQQNSKSSLGNIPILNDQPSTSTNISSHFNASESVSVFLATAIVKIKGPCLNTVEARVLIDQGSESSFVSERLVNFLNLKKERTNAFVSGLGGNRSCEITHSTELYLLSNVYLNSNIKIKALILPNITSYTSKSISLQDFPEIQGFELADSSSKVIQIDILLGVDYLAEILTGSLVKSSKNNLMAQSSIFGWIVSGSISKNISSHLSVHVSTYDDELRKFWEIEEVPVTDFPSEEDKFCEILFKDTTFRDETGRLFVRLPFKRGFNADSLGESYNIAKSSLLRIEKRNEHNQSLKKLYTDFLNEYEELGHMTKLHNSEIHNSKRYFIPHHGVLTEANGKVKIRVVFNASMKTNNNLSLNDILCIGPKLHNDLTSIILNWRTFRYVFTSDIEKMFRQIYIAKEDRPLQCILWRRNPSEEIGVYELNTITYGIGPSPFLSIRAIRELAQIYREDYPLAYEQLTNNIYVDDILSGADDLTTAYEIKNELVHVLSQGQMVLKKWSSNITEFSQNSESYGNQVEIGDSSSDFTKILGIIWYPREDVFQVSVVIDDKVCDTKRLILSSISKIFDPMGWLSPIIIVAKQIIQLLWLRKLTWDEKIPQDLQIKWNNFYQHLHTLKELKLPRWTSYTKEIKSYQLIGFSDASSLAYSAVVYSRVTMNNGEIIVNLEMAKTKVAPLKTLSIPKLELSAATLLTKLMLHVKDSLTRNIDSIICFSDSTITLAWLAKQPSCWEVFVANRISFIQTSLPEAFWSHVTSKQNPADLNSRGISVNEFITNSLWWSGPHFLRENEEITIQNDYTTGVCQRKNVLVQINDTEQYDLVNHFSSFTKLLHTYAYVVRFANILLKKFQGGKTSQLSLQEIEQGKNLAIRIIQNQHFESEIKSLQNEKSIPSNSNIANLSPFLNEENLLRLGGRLENANIPYNQKHPIILPKCRFSYLLLHKIHLETLHGGVQLMLQTLRQNFWVINSRRVAKKIVLNCTTCIRQRAKISQQYMASLPTSRCNITKAFNHTGIDYGGPFLLKDKSGRGHKTHKAWFAIFVCMATRAIHLELVSGYDTKSFIAALERFVSRRGKPFNIYCDNGTNFQGAKNELDKIFSGIIKDEKLHSKMNIMNIRWHFNPPAAPHFGGLWESGVKLVKFHLKRILGKFYPTWEEMLTLLCRIEACINSRPIVKLLDDPNNLEYLTPGHFLTGANLLAIPEPSYLNDNENYLTRWQKVSKLVQEFWKHWSQNYLHTLQNRQKWLVMNEGFKIGDIVLLKDPLHPPTFWLMARVIQVFPGANGVVRVVKIKTQKSELIRPITQLCKFVEV